MIPTADIMPMASPAAIFPSATPTKANGMENMITKGPRKLSNWEAITMYTRIMMRRARRIMSANIFCCSSKSPPICQVSPCGRGLAFKWDSTNSTPSDRAYPLARMPLTVM